jgi:hypothetical protein
MFAAWRSLQLSGAALLVAVAFMLGPMNRQSMDRAHAFDGKPSRWMLNGPGAAALAADPEASRLLANSRPYVMIGPKISSVPAGWKAISFVSFTRFAALKSAVASGVGPQINGVMYDYERWEFTPEDEQRNPAPYLRQAADLAHAQGLLFLTAPAVNLVRAMAPRDEGPRYDAYLRLGIAADAARYADVFDIQAQGSERNTELYASFVQQAAAQARQANPKVIVLAGISTQPSGQSVTADDIVRAIDATRDSVDGYWFNIPRPSAYCPRCREFRPDIAIEVLRRVSGQ